MPSNPKMMESGINNSVFFFSSSIAALCYSYFLSSKLPKGICRLISLLPIFSLFTILPLTLSSAFAAVVAAYFISWFANFNLLLFAFDHPPLYPLQSLLLFITTACLPVKPKSYSFKVKPPSNLWAKAAVMAVLVSLLTDHRRNLHPHFVSFLYCCMLVLSIQVFVAASSVVVHAVVGVELEPPSDEPYLATSLRDFWARRWNLISAGMLRRTVYKPVMSAFHGTAALAPLAAVLSSFRVSGLMHDWMFYCVTRVRPTWEITAFFVLQGVCVVVESVVKTAVAGKWELPAMVSRLLTLGFLLSTSFWLFFPPLIKDGADLKILEEMNIPVDYVTNMFKRFIVLA